MSGFETDYVNQIAINLRDRYKSGFPILKELIQNADDAGAKHLVFGFHPGHGERADHPLLHGPGLWVLNDGRFTRNDQRAIRSFGLNAKAGDAGSIGKFGLGMKSVFHLCECFLYVAHDGEGMHHDVLNPWQTEGPGATRMHRSWEDVTEHDLQCMGDVARAQPEAREDSKWFLLWLPLRQHSHVPHEDGQVMAAIIERYPGDTGGSNLDFLSDGTVSQRVEALLPLLENLDSIRFHGTGEHRSFGVTLVTEPAGVRLDHESGVLSLGGRVVDDRSKSRHLRFLATQSMNANDAIFRRLRKAPGWPTSMAITSDGRRESCPDKANAEGAVMLAHADGRSGQLRLQWAVFLPTEEGASTYHARVPSGLSRDYQVILHGQFFVDGGRRGIKHADSLGRRSESAEFDDADQECVIATWNQRLAQEVVLPTFLPTLARYVQTERFKDDDIAMLTMALRDCVNDAGERFFAQYRDHVCKQSAWVCRLTRKGSRWELIETAQTLLSLPRPPRDDPERPWHVLPGLDGMTDVVYVDRAAPYLALGLSTWEPWALCGVLSRLNLEALRHETGLTYLATFLEQEKEHYINTSQVQTLLVSQLRAVLRRQSLTDVRGHRRVWQRVLAVLGPTNLYGMGARDTQSKTALAERTYRRLLGMQTEALPIPGDLLPEGFKPEASQSDLVAWLDALAQAITDRDAAPDALLRVAYDVVSSAGDEQAQTALLNQCGHLAIMGAVPASEGITRPMTLIDLAQAHDEGRLFRVRDPSNPLGLANALYRAVPASDPIIIQGFSARCFNLVCRGKKSLPGNQDIDAMLRWVGDAEHAPVLGSENDRLELLSEVGSAHLESEFSKRGVRYLLHGSREHFHDGGTLYKDPAGQQSPWVRLWRMTNNEPWRVLPDALCAVIPDKHSCALGIWPVDENLVKRQLEACEDYSRVDVAAFDETEVAQMLGRVTDEAVWRRLPLHRDHADAFGPVNERCFLGHEPALPTGVQASVRFITPSRDEHCAANQKKWLCRWNASTAIEFVLKSETPRQHWRYLMELVATEPDVVKSLSEAWRSVPWLPLQDGGAIAIDCLLNIDGMDDEIRKLAADCEYAYASVTDLRAECREHEAFAMLVAQVASDADALDTLGQMMEAAGNVVGDVIVADADLVDHLHVLADLSPLPAWRVVDRAVALTSKESVVDKLLPLIGGLLSTVTCRDVLKQLSGLSVNDGVRAVYKAYLRQWRHSAGVDELRAELPRLRLISQAGTWEQADDLATGINGIVQSSELCHSLADVLLGVVTVNGRGDMSAPGVRSGTMDDTSAASDLAGALEAYVEPLIGTGAQQAVGALLGLFGEPAMSMAKNWLDPIHYDDYVAKLGWKDPGRDSDGRWDWMSRKSAHDALASMNIRLRVEEGQKISAVSLTGATRQFASVQTDTLNSLFIGDDQYGRNGSYSCRLRLYPLSVLEDRDLPQQQEVLIRTCESVLKRVYNQHEVNLSGFLELSKEADQVTLAVARQMILDGLPQMLRSLRGIQKNDTIKQSLMRLDQARKALASARAADRDDGDAKQAYDDALANLAHVVESDGAVQAHILRSIRDRVRSNQYELSSIPFEVFQNADDAVIEMQALQRQDGRNEFSHDAIGRFVVRTDEHWLRFVHWGRPINDRGRDASKNPDYGNDLERMLMLGASAKDEDVTGKFGLGFKSLILASTTPRVASANLAFEIVAGCLPQQWKVPDPVKNFRKQVVTASQKMLRLTLIELPLDEDVSLQSIVSRFKSLAGMLPVFAHTMASVEVDNEVHHWHPENVIGESGCCIETGTAVVPLVQGRTRNRLLVFRMPSGSVAVCLSKQGIESFDQKADIPVPRIWVTAPTRGTAAGCLVLNAPFRIDPGRAALAHSREADIANRELAARMGDEAGSLLMDLFNESCKAWPRIAKRMALSDEVSALEFWRGLWARLLRDEPETDTSADAHIAHVFSQRAFCHVVRRSGVVPNGFSGEHGVFARPEAIALCLDERFKGDSLSTLQSWPRFMSKYPVGQCCTGLVRKRLIQAGLVSEDAIPFLSVRAVIGCLPDGRLVPADVDALAGIIKYWSSLDREAWRRDLPTLYMQARDNSWQPTEALLDPLREDVKSIVGFAPTSAILHPSYDVAPQSLCLVADRFPFNYPATDRLAQWCIHADGKKRRKAAIQFLTTNPYGPIVDALTEKREYGGWLFALDEQSPELAGVEPPMRAILLRRLGGLDAGCSGMDPVREPLGVSLEDVCDWWRERKDLWLPKYDHGVWPAAIDRARLRARDPYDRTAWMTLFSLGAFRRLGRTTDEQHRGFIEFLDQRGWWPTICEINPADDGEAWLAILWEYADSQQVGTSFELWMDSFPRLYRLARWLDDYVHLFQTLDQRTPKDIHGFLTPGADPVLSGSGIDAPTLRSALRLGQHLVVRELLRVGVLSSPVAEAMAYSPGVALIRRLENDFDFYGRDDSASIHDWLAGELGEKRATFEGCYDIPLQLLASHAEARDDMWQWMNNAGEKKEVHARAIPNG